MQLRKGTRQSRQAFPLPPQVSRGADTSRRQEEVWGGVARAVCCEVRRGGWRGLRAYAPTNSTKMFLYMLTRYLLSESLSGSDTRTKRCRGQHHGVNGTLLDAALPFLRRCGQDAHSTALWPELAACGVRLRLRGGSDVW